MSDTLDPTVLRRKADQHWEMAGKARKYERLLREVTS